MASGSEASCVNDPNFAIICSFFEKFSSMLNIQQPDIHTLQAWLENSEEVAPGLRQLHIKLLRKMRKTVHETAWETALAKFCYLYSAQDAWEIERFGYKKSSLKVKLRILTAILEYQFQLNGKFRNKFSNMTAEELRSEPIGRDRSGHSYWLTQDPSCNFRIYQEHLDEEIWQVVASNRSEMQTLISRLKGNEVVLPSLIGVIDEDSSSNSCANAIIKPPPPEEQDDSQSSSCGSNNKAKVPNIKIKLENGNVVETNGDLANGATTETIEKPAIKPEVKEEAENEDEEESSDEEEEEAEEEEDEEEAEEEEDEEDKSDDEEGEEEEEEEDYKGEEDRKEDLLKVTKSEDVVVKTEDVKPGLTNGNIKDEVVTANGMKTTPRKLKPLVISNAKVSPSEDKPNTKKRALSISTNGEPETEQPASKKGRPTLSDDRRGKKSKYEKSSEEEDDEEEGDEDEDEEEEEDEGEEAEENDEEAINGDEADGDEEIENDEGNEVGEAIEEETLIVKGEGSGKDCESSSSSCFLRNMDFGCDDTEEQVGEAIEEEVMYIYGEGSGQCCLVGNPTDESNESILVKHSKEIDLQTKTKQVDIKLSEPDENKNDDSKNCLTNGEICDDKDEGNAQLVNNDGGKASNDKPTTTDENEKNVDKLNDTEDTNTNAAKKNATGGTDKHQTSDHIKSSEHVASPTLTKTKDASPMLEKEVRCITQTAGCNANNLTCATKDAPKPNFDLDRSTEPPDIQTTGITTKDDDPSSVQPDFALANSRKRRLSEDKISRDPSESESDLNSDSAAPPTEEEDIGGKRPKMRLKVVNTEIRKKVEQARKSHEDAKSTSEEEGTTEDKNGDDRGEENDPLQISEQDRQKAEPTQGDVTNVPDPVPIQTRTTRHTPAGTPIKAVTTSSSRGRKKPGKQRYTKRIPGIPSLEPETPIAEGETRSEDDPDANKMPKLEPATGSSAEREIKSSPGQKKARGLKRDIDTSNIIDASEIPVRQSRRIAQLKIREEAERRKLEEEALKKMKAEFKKKKKEEITSKGMPVPSDTSGKSEEDSEAEEGKKFSAKKKGGRMWKKSGWSSGPDEPEEDDEYEIPHERYDSERGSPLFKSDHEFSPESDIEDESQAVPLKRARTVRKEGVEYDGSKMDESCQKCGKNDHPEWILLCDKCDKGYHCSCLSPVLFIIPEGDWFCPPCQQEQLIAALEKQMTVLDEAVEEKQRREEEAKKAEVELKLKLEEEEQQQAKVDDEEPDHKEVKYRAKKNRAERAKRRNRPKGRKSFLADDDDESEESEEDGDSSGSASSSDDSETGTKSSSKTSDSEDNEPIYKLRKRRQVNVSYRLNEYDHLINSAIKEEMDEVAGAGNLGRGKDISTIIEADKEEKMRQKQMTTVIPPPEETIIPQEEEIKEVIENVEEKIKEVEPIVKEEEKVVAPVKIKSRSMSKNLKKKSRKLNNLDISSDDDGSDEDFKTSSYDTEEDESISEATDSDSSLEVYRKRGKKNKKGKREKTKRPQRRAARQRRRLDDFIVDDSEWSDEAPKRRKVKRKHNWELRDTESEDELSDQIDSEELCDDTTDSEDSDGCWRPSKRRKTKSKGKGGKSKKAANPLGPRGGKQPRKFNRKNSGERSFKSKSKSKSKLARDTDDSDEDVPRTRGKRFTYLDSFDEESSDDGIKPGVKRPDTPPEEREKFIKKQEEIKRMLAEKNTEAAKAVATPTLAPVDSLSTVPLSVIKGAKALDLDYLHRKGELNSEEGETDFDEDLPDDFDPEAMDEEEIAKMMEEEDFAQQQIKLTNDVIRPKKKDSELLEMPQMRSYPVGAPPPPRESSGPQLQEPPRKRLPMPTLHPPLSGMSRFLPPGARVPYDTPIRQHLPSTVPLSMQSAMQGRPMPSGIGGSMPPGHSMVIPSVVGAPATHPVAGQNQNSGAEPAKPRGRRKKITPLRDTLQKQQAAAAAAAAASTGPPVSQPSNAAAVKEICLAPPENSPAGVMRGPAQLSVAQPPQLYTPPTSTPPSVITRMPQVSSVPPSSQQPPLLTQGPPQHRPPRPPFPEQNSRFYSPPNQIPPHRMSIIRHGAPMPPPPHHPLGPNFASGPPPLRPASPRIPASVGNAVVNRQPSPRPLTTFSPNDQYGAARPPPPQQHPTPPHAYRPPLYGTPGYPPAPPQQSQNPMHPTAPDYANVPTSYGPAPPYGGPYYPPPPPPQQNMGPAHSTPPAPAVSSVPVSSPLPLPTLSASVPASTPPQPAPPVANVTTASTPPHSMPIPVTPIAEPTIVGQTSQAARPNASVLETFDSKSRSPLLEADVPSSPYSNSGIVEDHEEDVVTSPPANTTSEFSGLVSYFSSQHDDFNS